MCVAPPPPPTSCVTVNFIDPTTTSANHPASPDAGGPTPPNRGRRWKGSAPAASAQPPRDLDLYKKLVNVFRRDYDFTLRSVPHSNLRTGQSEPIDSLPVRCVLTGGGGGGDALSAWGGKAVETAPVSDPAEWHIGPYCHVYLAACQDADHYRHRVRPALQAFVSQIEGAGGLNADGSALEGTPGGGSGKGGSRGKRGSSVSDRDEAASNAAAAAAGGNV